MGKEKNLTIETLRGVAIVLVVVGHVIGSAPDGGMKIDFPSPWRYLYLWIDYIQMPLFTAIAGWVYALKSVDKLSMPSFTFSKFKRLLVPMAAVATIYFLVQYFTPGTNTKPELDSIWRIYIFPYTIFWYLQSLFLIFVVVALVDKRRWMQSVERWLWVLGGACVVYVAQITLVAGHSSNLFSFQGAMNLLPYFIIGVGVQRFGQTLYRYKTLFFALATVGLLVLQVRWFAPAYPQELYQCLLPLWVGSTLIVALRQKFKSRAFVFLGTYAYSIYLFHGFGTSGGRIILTSIGVDSQLVVFVFATLIALFVPILVDRILSKNRLTRAIFLGKAR
ncbi:MAG: acyltransferase [Mucinivorans sp.]